MTPEDSKEPPNYQEALSLLTTRINFEAMQNFSADEMGRRMDQMRQMLASIGGPERQYRTFHVAGTKGKGSTCTMLDAILQAGGLQVGLYTSPHLDTFLERFQINGVLCSKDNFANIMLSLRDRMMEADRDLFLQLTYFELTTFFAFEYFAKEQVDTAVLEVGLGGRLDATNLCSPSITLITSIGLDHVAQLGTTVAEIAAEKSGIIKPTIPLVSGVRDPDVRAVIQQAANRQDADAYFLEEAFYVQDDPDGSYRFRPQKGRFPRQEDIVFRLPHLHGEHQKRNAALAIAAVQLLRHREELFLTEESIQKGLSDAFVPVRMEFLTRAGFPTLIVDGAHDRSSIQAFIDTIRRHYALEHRPWGERFTLLFGTTQGKDVQGMVAELIPWFDRIVLTQYSSTARSLDVWELKEILDQSCNLIDGEKTIEVVEDPKAALGRCWNRAEARDVICITGSMYLAAELRRFSSATGYFPPVHRVVGNLGSH